MKFKNYAMLAPALVLLASCASEDPWSQKGDGTGSINLLLSASGHLDTASPQTRAVTTTVEAPAPEEFSIRLSKKDGSYSKTWNTLGDFQKDSETGFSVGSYEIEAFYGSPESQGFGKENAYFTGKTDVTVLEGVGSPVELTATIGNAAVYIEYSDAFKRYFTSWSTQLQSAGHDYVNFSNFDGKQAYIIPGSVSVIITAMNQNGQELKLNPASFTAAAGNLYKITYDVYNGEVGDAQLVISFDDHLDEESVIIDLTEELYSTSAPEITADGFTPGDNIEVLEKTANGNPTEPIKTLKMDVLATGGLASAVMEFNSSMASTLGTRIDLCAATDLQKENLAKLGIKAVGFFNNPDKMAALDLTGLLANLEPGTHTITLTATDKYGRSSGEPVKIILTALPMEVNATPSAMTFGTRYADITIDYNGIDPTQPGKNPFTFEARADLSWEKADIVSINGEAVTRAFPPRAYTYRIAMPEREGESVGVRVYFNGNMIQEVNVPVEFPQYSLEADAFARHAFVKVTPADASIATATLARYLRMFNNGTALPTTVVDAEQGIVKVSNLEPSTQYTLTSALVSKPANMLASVTFTTEAAADVPNGDFSQIAETINIGSINAGGQYKYGATTMQNKSSIRVSEPSGWASVNKKTCYLGSNPMNTWFVVPSTLASAGSVTLRSVAYDHAGTMPALDDHGLTVRKKYSRNAPASWSSYAAGELFLGSYDFNGSEQRENGVNFASRPSSMTFTYNYAPVNSEKAYAYIAVIDAEGNVISAQEQELNGVSQDTSATLSLPKYVYGKKAAKLYVWFKSSLSDSPAAPKPTDLEDVSNSTSLSGQTIGTNNYKSLCVGSQLTLKNVHLNY